MLPTTWCSRSELSMMSAPSSQDVWLNLPMTWWDGKFGTWAGRLVEAERSFWFSSLGRRAYSVVGAMCFVQILEPQWCRERYLWDQLHAACDLLQLPLAKLPYNPTRLTTQP